MDQKSLERINLDPLPESEDKEFWGDGEIHKIYVGDLNSVGSDGPHYFERVSGHQAQCNHCGWGFQLDPGDRIDGGHLYDKKGNLVI